MNKYYKNEPYIIKNDAIRFHKVRVLDNTRQFIGIMSSYEANKLAQSKNTDLILIAKDANPPVCVLEDLNKFLYNQKIKEKEQIKKERANARQNELKEIQLHPNTGKADLNRKLLNGNTFLADGHKLKISVQFRGREQAFMQDDFNKIFAVMKSVLTNGILSNNPVHAGNIISVIFNPIKK